MTRKHVEDKGRELGVIAFKSGRKCIPALHADAINMLGNPEIAKHSVAYLKAWRFGWCSAHNESIKFAL